MSRAHPILDRFLWQLRSIRTVHPGWLWELKRRNFRSGKIRVGFGHVHTNETTLTNRKWHIDPIVNGINRYSDRYVADIFFPFESLSRFDIVVMLKHLEFAGKSQIMRLKEQGKRLLFNISDNPSGCKIRCEEATWFLDAVDALLLLNPLQGENLPRYSGKFNPISTPIINSDYKRDYDNAGPVKIFWDGFADNLYTLDRLTGIVKEVAKACRVDVEFVINSNIPERDDGIVKYRAWSIDNWHTRMLECDIGALIKPVDDARQQKKPATKLITYMAAGLPVICTPSAADRGVLRDGKTGFFAHTDEEWFARLKQLIEDPGLRERIGRAAHEDAVSRFSIEQVTRQYTDIFDTLMETSPNS